MQSQAHAAVRPGGLTARCVQSTPGCKSTITWCWYSTIRCCSGCQSSVVRTGTRANPSRQPLLGRCKKRKKKVPTQCSRRHTLQFALAGSLHAVCNLRLFLRALQALVRSVALPSLCGKGGLRGGEVGVPHSFGREKDALFESQGKIFRTSMCTHLPPPPPFATVSHQIFTLFRRMVVCVDGKRPSNFQGHS